MPKISVVMPAYNAEKYIAEAIKSILNQTFSDFEFIIIDDGSTDRTVNIVNSFSDERIRFFQNESNLGVAETLNRGLDLASGQYIARMDSDDISLPERFEMQASFMDEHPEIAVLGAGIELFGAQTGKRVFSGQNELLKIDLLFGNCFAHPAIMMRASCFGDGKFCYDRSFNQIEDFELWDRVSRCYKMASLSEVLLKYRIHPGQVTQKVSEVKKRQIRELKERQLRQLEISYTQEEFEQFVQYCLGEFTAEEDSVRCLSSFFDKIKAVNRHKRIYDRLQLDDYLDHVIWGCLSKFSLVKAVKIASQCHVRAVSYGVRRLTNGIIAKARGVVQKQKLRSRLKSKDFSIISNNCWGSFIYQKYGIKYQSPTAGLFILGHDFVKLCAKWEWYFAQKLEFIPFESSAFYSSLHGVKPYPVAKLADIEVYFMHYATEAEAAEKWYRRIERINPDKIIFKLSQREECSKEDVVAFMNLPLKNKVCFSYDSVQGAILVPELKGFSGDEQPLLEQYFDEVKLINSL